MYTTTHPKLIFSQAAERRLNARGVSVGRASYLAPRTVWDLQQYIRALNRRFRNVPLRKITIKKIRDYLADRAKRAVQIESITKSDA